jgi:hypothetical protein
VSRVFGRTGLNVISRIMGLILAAVAIQFVLDGTREAFPGWAARGPTHDAADAPSSTPGASTGGE